MERPAMELNQVQDSNSQRQPHERMSIIQPIDKEGSVNECGCSMKLRNVALCTMITIVSFAVLAILSSIVTIIILSNKQNSG